MYKGIKIGLIVIGLVSAVLWFFMPQVPDSPPPEVVEQIAAEDKPIQFMFVIMWIMVAIAAIASLFFGLSKMLTTPGGLKKTLFSIGGLAVLFILGYAISSSDEAQAVVNVFDGKEIQPTLNTVKNIGMLLNVFFFMTAIAVLLMIVPSVKRIFSK